jgi:hypothetical protein
MLDSGRLSHGLLIVDTRVRAGLGGRQDEELVARVEGGRASGREDEELTGRGNLERHFLKKRLLDRLGDVLSGRLVWWCGG